MASMTVRTFDTRFCQDLQFLSDSPLREITGRVLSGSTMEPFRGSRFSAVAGHVIMARPGAVGTRAHCGLRGPDDTPVGLSRGRAGGLEPGLPLAPLFSGEPGSAGT